MVSKEGHRNKYLTEIQSLINNTQNIQVSFENQSSYQEREKSKLDWEKATKEIIQILELVEKDFKNNHYKIGSMSNYEHTWNKRKKIES